MDRNPAGRRLSRRQLAVGLGAGLGALCLAPCCAGAWPWRPARAEGTRLGQGGCTLAAGDLAGIEAALGKGGVDYGAGFLPTSGDPTLDRELGKALVRLSQLYGERPGFGFYDDAESQNAFASGDTRIPGTWGTVLFGKTLFWTLLQHQDGGMSVLAVLAHEFAHVIQIHRGLRQRLLAGQATVKRNELHADFLSGFYLGTRKREFRELTLYEAGVTFRQLGDTDFTDPQHHGTPAERVAAAEAGFAIGIEGGTIDTAIARGMDHVLRT